MNTIKFNNGHSIPLIGLGTWTSPPDKIHTAVSTALETGYRHIDCAYVYRNEAEIGEALAECLPRLKLKREDIFITSKLWTTFLRPDLVRGACQTTLKNLKLKYLDLYLIHWPVSLQPGGENFPKNANNELLLDSIPLTDTWKEMEKLVDDGLVKSIGISNFNKRQIDLIMSNCRIKPVNLQVEIHANFPNLKLVKYAQSMGLTVTAYAPLGSPGASPGRENLLTQPRVVSLAEKYKKTPAQVLLRYLLDRQIIVVPKSVTPERIKENFQIFDFKLTPDEVEQLNTTGLNERQFKLLSMSTHPEYPFNDDY